MSWDDLFAWPAGPRFVVGTVTGHRIDAGTMSYSSGKRTMPVCAYVQDRAYCHRIVASFVTNSRWARDPVAAAERAAAELNAWDEEVAA